MDQQLSKQALNAIKLFNDLPLNEQAVVVSLISTNLAAKIAEKASSASPDALVRAGSTIAEQIAKKSIPIQEMKAVLRDADCLFDKAEIWMQLGAKEVPGLPESLIQEAYEKGGRIILQCSSISEKAKTLRAAGCRIDFWDDATSMDYRRTFSEPRWIVVPSHVDQATIGSLREDVVDSMNPATTTENAFAVRAYAILDGRRQAKGCENIEEFTTESGTVVGSYDGRIEISKGGKYGRQSESVGAGRFGPRRN